MLFGQDELLMQPVFWNMLFTDQLGHMLGIQTRLVAKNWSSWQHFLQQSNDEQLHYLNGFKGGCIMRRH
jgi:hypothetical protein